MENKIQRVVRARIASFTSSILEIDSVDHSSTNGDLRETILKRLLTAILPKQFSVRSGFICDATGGVSRQLDLVIIDNYRTPEILLDGDVDFIPVEAALMAIEVKSIVKAGNGGALHQLQSQINSVTSLKPVTVVTHSSNVQSSYIVPFLLFGFKSDVTFDTLKSWFGELNGLNTICIFNRELRWRGKNIEQQNPLDKHEEVLRFVAMVVEIAERVTGLRKEAPRNMHYYIAGIPRVQR